MIFFRAQHASEHKFQNQNLQILTNKESSLLRGNLETSLLGVWCFNLFAASAVAALFELL